MYIYYLRFLVSRLTFIDHPETHRFDPLTSFSWEDVQLLSDLNINVIRSSHLL